MIEIINERRIAKALERIADALESIANEPKPKD